MEENKVYICIDLKSFYASVECVDRKLNPLDTNLVVADITRTNKTVCLAVTPSLKAYGISGRARLFEVIDKVKQINLERKQKINNVPFIGKSFINSELENNPLLELDYLIAPPRMKQYIKYSTNIYKIYLKYIANEDIHVYSIDEVFCDITNYLKLYKCSAVELVTKILNDIYKNIGITATAGIGTNLYLAKIAMDIIAKHKEPNEFGVRVAVLDEKSYRELLWNHQPLTDFWRIGPGYSEKLNSKQIKTMGDIAKTSLENENLLYNLFGINAELLIDHAWGYEPCTIKDIKNYQPTTNSISSSQVLKKPYNFQKTEIIVKEMVELLSLELVKKKLITNSLSLTIKYEKVKNNNQKLFSHSSVKFNYTSKTSILMQEAITLYEKIIKKNLLVRKIHIAIHNLVRENFIEEKLYDQLSLFSNNIDNLDTEKQLQKTIIDLKIRYGKNVILRGMNFRDGATTIERNKQIGGHRE